MAKWNVEVVKKFRRIIEVEGDTFYDAVKKLESEPKNGEYDISNMELEDVSYSPHPPLRFKSDFAMNIDFSKSQHDVVISFEDSSGCSYSCHDLKDFINSVKSFAENYLEYQQIKAVEEKNKEDNER